jgi:hypothetical protein
MERRAALTICVLAMLVLSWSTTNAHASSVNYAIHDGKVSVELSLHFFQNVTAMPSLSETFTGVAAQNLASAIEDSLKNTTSSISVSSLSGELASNKDWVNATIRFDVSGVTTQNGSLLNVNCSWIRLKVSNELRLGDLSYNLIGATYIEPTFEEYAGFEKTPLNETIATVGYRFGTQDVSPELAVQRAGNTTLLDFSYLVAPIEGWEMTYNLTQGSTTWVYTPAPAAEMKMMVAPRDGGAFHLDASYAYNATLSVDGPAQAHADTITTDISGGYEPLLMLVVVIATFVVAIVASWTFRSRRKQLPRRRK